MFVAVGGESEAMKGRKNLSFEITIFHDCRAQVRVSQLVLRSLGY